jgi:hypothetical protein
VRDKVAAVVVEPVKLLEQRQLHRLLVKPPQLRFTVDGLRFTIDGRWPVVHFSSPHIGIATSYASFGRFANLYGDGSGHRRLRKTVKSRGGATRPSRLTFNVSRGEPWRDV